VFVGDTKAYGNYVMSDNVEESTINHFKPIKQVPKKFDLIGGHFF
jgi:hypothetical protein